MVSDWETSTLGELAEIVMGQSPKGSECNSDGHGTPLLNGPTEFGSYHPYPTQFTTDPKRFSKKDDLLFCVRGSTTGRMNWSDKEYAIGRGLAAFRHKKGKEFQSFLKGVIDIKLPELLASATGSTFPNVSKNQLNDLEVVLPPLPEQKTIAHILGSLGDKIELNRQMNETLEAMAQALFKSWFVDFDPVIDNALAAGNAIPDEFIERAEQRKGIEKKDNSEIQSLFPDEFEFTEEMGWVPKGWAVGKYSDLAELNPLSWSKKSIPEEISYVDLGNTNNGKIDLVVSYSASEAPSRAKRVLSTDDTIIGTVRPGNRSFAFIHNEGLTGSTGFAVMKPIQSINRTYTYLGLTQSVVIEYLAHIADGGAYPAINPSVVADLECIIPPSEVLEKFDDLAYCFLKKIGENNNHNETLAKVRDALLPKLMSGELRIPDAEALVEYV